jgi:glycosyltransferase involved in cell wall biosynthesis
VVKKEGVKSMNVLYISYDGMTDQLGQSQVIPYLVALSKKGYNISVLSFEKKSAFKHKQASIHQLLQPYNIKWIHPLYHKSIAGTFFDFLKGTTIVWYHLMFKHVKLVHCRGHYLTSLMAYPWLRLLPLNRYIFDMRGFWADERVEGGLWDLDNKLHRKLFHFFKSVEKKCLHRADSIITLTQKAKVFLNSQYDSLNSISVIPCCTDLDLFNIPSSEVRTNYRESLKLKDNFVLLYLGSLGTWYMLDEMIHFFSILKQKENDAHFLFLTNDDAQQIYHKLDAYENLNRTDITVLASERKEVPNFMAACDASIFFIKPTFSKSASSPTKHGELLGCGLPIVCNTNIGDLDEIIKKTSSGILVNSFSGKNYALAIEQLLQFKNKDKSVLRNTAVKYYSLKDGVEKYSTIYNSLLKKTVKQCLLITTKFDNL